MKSWREPGFVLPLLIALVWGLWILGFHQDTMREKAFTLMMFVGLASSLNILLGYTGYVSFGHIVFFGLGGYTGFRPVRVRMGATDGSQTEVQGTDLKEGMHGGGG